MRRAIVTGCNIAFLPGAIGLLESVRTFHPDVARYCLVPPDEAEQARKVLADLAEVSVAPRPIRGVPDKPILHLLAGRTFIPTFPAEVVAWVDCDVVFCRPAPELWDVPSGKVNAVQDSVYNLGMMVPNDVWEHYVTIFPNMTRDQIGFNAGIYALRSSEWLNLHELYEAAIAPGRLPYYPPGFDQPLLNGLFHGRINWLPRAFNCHASYELGFPPGVRIIHYTANPKPWMPGYGAHNPGYYEWALHGEKASAQRAFLLRGYRVLATPRRYGYRALRKVLTKIGVWKHTVGVSNGTNNKSTTNT